MHGHYHIALCFFANVLCPPSSLALLNPSPKKEPFFFGLGTPSELEAPGLAPLITTALEEAGGCM
jgi:hypothetical protein